MLYSEYSDTEISTLFGFSSQSYFIKVFRKFIGVTPKEYKKRSAMQGLIKKRNDAENSRSLGSFLHFGRILTVNKELSC